MNSENIWDPDPEDIIDSIYDWNHRKYIYLHFVNGRRIWRVIENGNVVYERDSNDIHDFDKIHKIRKVVCNINSIGFLNENGISAGGGTYRQEKFHYNYNEFLLHSDVNNLQSWYIYDENHNVIFFKTGYRNDYYEIKEFDKAGNMIYNINSDQLNLSSDENEQFTSSDQNNKCINQ